MLQPKISVVTVCYNAAKDIEKTIRSVLNQTYLNIEYIIIDGASKDGTMDVVNKYKNKIACIVSEPDKGIYDAMNKGIDKATGDYVQFLNAGDILHSPEIFMNVFGKGSFDEDVVYGDIVYHMQCGNFYVVPAAIDDFKTTFPIAHPSTFVSRTVLSEYQFDTTYRIAADFDLLRRIYQANKTFKYVNEPIVYFDSITGVSSTSTLSAWIEYNKVLGNIEQDNWKIKLLKKRLSIKVKTIATSLLRLFGKKYLQKMMQERQLRNKRFTLIEHEK